MYNKKSLYFFIFKVGIIVKFEENEFFKKVNDILLINEIINKNIKKEKSNKKEKSTKNKNKKCVYEDCEFCKNKSIL